MSGWRWTERRERGAGFIQVAIVLVVMLVITILVLKMFERDAAKIPMGQGPPAKRILQKVTLQVEGVQAMVDAAQAEAALRRVAGVAGVQVDPGSGRAEISYNPGQTTPEAMIAALQRAGYLAHR